MLDKVSSIVEKYNRDKGLIVSILQDVQEEFRYLPKEALQQVSTELDVPLSQVYAVGTFYKTFSLEPRGEHVVHVCMGTACHVRGAELLLEKMERDLDVTRGKTTKDKKFTLEEVRCVGACALGPIVIVDGEYHGNVKLDHVDNVLKKYAG